MVLVHGANGTNTSAIITATTVPILTGPDFCRCGSCRLYGYLHYLRIHVLDLLWCVKVSCNSGHSFSMSVPCCSVTCPAYPKIPLRQVLAEQVFGLVPDAKREVDEEPLPVFKGRRRCYSPKAEILISGKPSL